MDQMQARLAGQLVLAVADALGKVGWQPDLVVVEARQVQHCRPSVK